MGIRESDTEQVKSVSKLLSIIEILVSEDGAGVTEVANELNMPPSTVYRYLNTLEQNKYVIQEGNTYRLGLKISKFGNQVKGDRKICQLAEPIVQELAEETKERAQFLVLEHNDVVYATLAQGQRAVEVDSHVGKRLPLHATASGKAILAHLPEEEIDQILENYNMEKLAKNTLTDRKSLLNELDEIRERGYSYNRQETTNGLVSIGTAITAPMGKPVGALTVSGPAHRLESGHLQNELPDMLLGAANELELKIEHS